MFIYNDRSKHVFTWNNATMKLKQSKHSFLLSEIKDRLSPCCRWYCRNINRSQAELLLHQKVTQLTHRANSTEKYLSVEASRALSQSNQNLLGVL